MKKWIAFSTSTFLLLAFAVSFSGCLKDTCSNTYTIYYPIYKTLSQVRADMKSSVPQPLKNTGKLNVYGNYIFLNEVGKGIHVIDNSNPAAPKNISFINIPNNVDLAIKGDFLYADSYSDLVVFDISNPRQVSPVKFVNNLVKEVNAYWHNNVTNPDSIRVVVGYTEKDTTVDCSTSRLWRNCSNCLFASAGNGATGFTITAPQVGVGGSMARFTIVNNYLYAVSQTSLYSVSISTPAAPQLSSTRNLGWGIETIYPFSNKLFIGSRTGMFIYDLSNPASPTQQGSFTHAMACDPVIADNNYAYVTLRSGNFCNNQINQLDVIDISNLSAPKLKKTFAMKNPHGLAKDGNKLFICDGADGLKMYDASSPESLQIMQKIAGIETFDVIAFNGKAIVVARDGLYQYDYSGGTLNLLSKIPVQKK